MGRDDTSGGTQQQWLLLDLTYNFNAIPILRYQEQIVSLACALSESDDCRRP